MPDDLQAAIDLLRHSGLVKLLETAHSEPVERWPMKSLLMSAKEFDMVSDGEENDSVWGLGRTGSALLTVLAEAEKTVAIQPDPEVATAIATAHALLGEMSCALVRTDEWAAFNLLVNRASGVTVTRLRAEIAAERARADEAEINAARYEALCGLSCEVAQKDNPAGVVAVLWHVPKFLRTKTDLQLNALADALLAEGTAPPEGSAT
jgi:hypothetical protein